MTWAASFAPHCSATSNCRDVLCLIQSAPEGIRESSQESASIATWCLPEDADSDDHHTQLPLQVHPRRFGSRKIRWPDPERAVCGVGESFPNHRIMLHFMLHFCTLFTVDVGMHHTKRGCVRMLGEDVMTRNGNGRDKHDIWLSSQSVELSKSISIRPLPLGLPLSL